MASIDISCAFPPSPAVADHVVAAESLGYERAWLYDSAALYPDVWVHLARCAERTSRIGLGPAVLVPGFRHPLAQASAIATLADLAPGRVAIAIGTGFTGRMTLGQRPHTWAETTSYIKAVRDLLAGHDAEIEGSICRLIPPAGFLPQCPLEIPLVVAANGPKGLAAARELDADGVMSIFGAQPGWEWSSLLVFGTVLDETETLESQRVCEAAGPSAAAVLHGMYEAAPSAVDSLQNGAEWRAALEAEPTATRHLALHADHLVNTVDRDAPMITPELLAFTWTGTPDEMRSRLAAFGDAGGTEVLYAPCGPDIDRELRAFAEMTGLKAV